MGDRVPIVDEPQADYGRYGTGFELRDVDIESKSKLINHNFETGRQF